MHNLGKLRKLSLIILKLGGKPFYYCSQTLTLSNNPNILWHQLELSSNIKTVLDPAFNQLIRTCSRFYVWVCMFIDFCIFCSNVESINYFSFRVHLYMWILQRHHHVKGVGLADIIFFIYFYVLVSNFPDTCI